jgi:hypothetical protein
LEVERDEYKKAMHDLKKVVERERTDKKALEATLRSQLDSTKEEMTGELVAEKERLMGMIEQLLKQKKELTESLEKSENKHKDFNLALDKEKKA